MLGHAFENALGLVEAGPSEHEVDHTLSVARPRSAQTEARSFRKLWLNTVRLPTGLPFGLPETPGGHIRHSHVCLAQKPFLLFPSVNLCAGAGGEMCGYQQVCHSGCQRHQVATSGHSHVCLAQKPFLLFPSVNLCAGAGGERYSGSLHS